MRFFTVIIATLLSAWPASSFAALTTYTYRANFTYGAGLEGYPFTVSLSYDTDLLPSYASANYSTWTGSFGTVETGVGTAELDTVRVARSVEGDEVYFRGIAGEATFKDPTHSILTGLRLPTSSQLGAFPVVFAGYFDARGFGGTYIGTQSAVPEPSTWTMMIAGFLAVAVALRRREKSGVAERA
jgi:hypothetical protein